jgi:uncharacterized membrane protein YbhN (UPF0104 family)
MTQVLRGAIDHRRSRTTAPIVLSLVGSLVLGAVCWLNRAWLVDALLLVENARVSLLGGALGLILLSYFVSSQVFHVVLRSLGRDLGVLRLWATTVTAIVISQSVPAGGAGSYAFLMSVFKRRKVPAGEAALLAALEALSYVGAVGIIGAWSVAYILFQTVGRAGSEGALSYLGAVFAGAVCVAGGCVVVTRPERTLRRWSALVGRGVARLRRRPDDGSGLDQIVAELVHGRSLVAARPLTAVVLVAIQTVALIGHSLALLLILSSLGVSGSFGVALAAFGVTLLTSTFNVLPGGGGTVETALAAVLMEFAIGPVAIPAAIVFRLLNFWALVPLAYAGYLWVQHGSMDGGSPERRTSPSSHGTRG